MQCPRIQTYGPLNRAMVIGEALHDLEASVEGALCGAKSFVMPSTMRRKVTSKSRATSVPLCAAKPKHKSCQSYPQDLHSEPTAFQQAVEWLRIAQDGRTVPDHSQIPLRDRSPVLSHLSTFEDSQRTWEIGHSGRVSSLACFSLHNDTACRAAKFWHAPYFHGDTKNLVVGIDRLEV